MSKTLLSPCLILNFLVATLCFNSVSYGQPATTPPQTTDAAQVKIVREALNLIPTENYKVQLTIQPQRYIEVIATTDGIVESLGGNAGSKLREQTEIVRIDNTRDSILLKKAKADYEAGRHKVALAKENKGGYQLLVVEEELKSLSAVLELAQLDYDRKVLRAPFEGKINAIYVTKGQYVRFGQTLAAFGDNSQLMVNIPVDRKKTKEGDEVSFKIEGAQAKGKIQTINPLSREFEALREIITSPATAIVFIDNTNGALAPGQSVYIDLVPSHPVCRVPNLTISNAPASGDRKVQIIRDNVVRDIVVKVYAQVGEDSTYICGPFKPGDELITSSSIPLTDGTALAPAVAGASTEHHQPGNKPKMGADF